jgi:ribonucleoside-diphosphate reductase alpha chain
MGFADALYKLSVAYNSEEGLAWGARFMRFVNDEAHNYSEHLAKVRGCFPNWQGSIWQTRGNRVMRNAATTTVAPTGTISIIGNCSGGIEPLFSLAFTRNVLRGQREGDKPLVETNETFRHVAGQRGFLTHELLERIARDGTLAHIREVPEDVKNVFVCAYDVTPEWHVRMQAVFQEHCDSSISKTINFLRDASREDVERIYRFAFKLRCKGVTVYRDGCRSFQPMALRGDADEGERVKTGSNAVAGGDEPTASTAGQKTGEAISTAAPAAADRGGNGNNRDEPGESAEAGRAQPVGTVIPVPPRIEPQDLPEIVSGLRIRQMTPFGNMHVKITVDPRTDRELEVFAQLGKGGDVATSDLEAICRMTSLWLRSGGSLRHVIKQLEGIGSSLQIPTRTGRIMSLGDGLAVTLKKYVRAKERFGLRSLLLGEIDLAELDNPSSPPHTPERNPSDRTLQSELPARSSVVKERIGGPAGSRGILTADQTSAEGGDELGHAPRAAGVASEAPVAAAAEVAEELDMPSEGPGTVATMTAVAELPETRMDLSDEVAWTDHSPAVVAVAAAAGRTAPPGNGQAAALLPAGMPMLRYVDKAAHYKLKCPECGSGLTVQEGCRKCHNCGWAAC